MKPIKAVYNFVVGDMTILLGTVIAVILLLIIGNVSALSAVKNVEYVLMIVIVLLSLILSLAREAYSKKR
jgi:hypothetical protein